MLAPYQNPLAELAYLHDQPTTTGIIKQQPQDFIVEEQLGFSLTGEGEHLWLSIEKTQLTTQQAIELIAKHFKVQKKQIGYAGQKDKQAITTQWFSVPLAIKKEIDLSDFQHERLRIVDHYRHGKKAKIGCHQGNRFHLTIRSISNPQELVNRLEKIQQYGVPNYFGEQRFGYQGRNIEQGIALIKEQKSVRQHKIRSQLLSSLRSYVFNSVLSQRLQKGYFLQPLIGDVLLLAGTRSRIQPDLDQSIIERVQQQDLLLAAPMIGIDNGELLQNNQFLQQHLQAFSEWQEYLIAQRVEQDWRAIHLFPQNLQWQQLIENEYQISFDLPKGCFATALLREVVLLNE